MIEIALATLLTPGSLATPPPATPAAKAAYDWAHQTAIRECSGQDVRPLVGTIRGTTSIVANQYVLDDSFSD